MLVYLVHIEGTKRQIYIHVLWAYGLTVQFVLPQAPNSIYLITPTSKVLFLLDLILPPNYLNIIEQVAKIDVM